jgi:hypothetical protein
MNFQLNRTCLVFQTKLALTTATFLTVLLFSQVCEDTAEAHLPWEFEPLEVDSMTFAVVDVGRKIAFYEMSTAQPLLLWQTTDFSHPAGDFGWWVSCADPYDRRGIDQVYTFVSKARPHYFFPKQSPYSLPRASICHWWWFQRPLRYQESTQWTTSPPDLSLRHSVFSSANHYRYILELVLWVH